MTDTKDDFRPTEHGIRAGELTVIVARSNVGKTVYPIIPSANTHKEI